MWRCSPLIAMVLILAAPGYGLAKSGYVRPPEPKTITAGVMPHVSLPRFTPHELVGGCGRGRFMDAATHHCRGPGDIRR